MEFIELIKTPKHDNVVMIDSFGHKIEGTLCITSHHLIISSRNDQLNELFVRFIRCFRNLLFSTFFLYSYCIP